MKRFLFALVCLVAVVGQADAGGRSFGNGRSFGYGHNAGFSRSFGYGYNAGFSIITPYQATYSVPVAQFIQYAPVQPVVQQVVQPVAEVQPVVQYALPVAPVVYQQPVLLATPTYLNYGPVLGAYQSAAFYGSGGHLYGRGAIQHRGRR